MNKYISICWIFCFLFLLFRSDKKMVQIEIEKRARQYKNVMLVVDGLRVSSGFMALPFSFLNDDAFYLMFKLNTENCPKT